MFHYDKKCDVENIFTSTKMAVIDFFLIMKCKINPTVNCFFIMWEGGGGETFGFGDGELGKLLIILISLFRRYIGLFKTL